MIKTPSEFQDRGVKGHQKNTKLEGHEEPATQEAPPQTTPEAKDDGYIELVLRVMARMCDGQNENLQDYLREQPDNIKSFNIIAEVTRFLDVIYSNINGKSIDLVIQLFETMNEFTAGNQENRLVIYDNKIIDYINFIMRAGDMTDCSTEKVGTLLQQVVGWQLPDALVIKELIVIRK